MKQKLFFVILAFLVAITAWANGVEIDGIHYVLNSSTNNASVTYTELNYKYFNSYSGDIIIPASVTYDGTTYSVTSIGSGAFYNCTGLTSITIPESVTYIGYYAFSGCKGLKSITIGNSVTSIGSEAFYNCTGLTSVTIPDSVTSIGDYAFRSCTGLTSITIGNSVTSIGREAFDHCTSLTSITIGNSVTSIGTWAFNGCTGLTSVTINSNDIVSKAYKTGSNLSYIFGSQVTTYILGDSVTSIGDYAFYRCTGLTSITIPNSVISIGRDAFGGCEGLTEVNITDIAAWCAISFSNYSANPLSYAHHLYLNGEEVKELTIPEPVTSIGDYAFADCTGLTSINIPNSVTTIGDYAFDRCTGLTSLTIPSSVTSIGDGAFYACSGLTSINIPNSVTTIGDYAFRICTGLTSITIGNSVTSIGRDAFLGCTGLTSITIGNSVTSIGRDAFLDCTNLTSVTINSNELVSKENTTSSSILMGIFGSQVTNCIIGDNVTSIGSSAFRGCTGLTSITIGNSVTSIGNSAFRGCTGLTSITIGNSVTSIGSEAFYNCTGLTSVTIGNSVTSIGNYAFYGCSGLTKVNISDIVSWCKVSFGDNPLRYANHLYLNDSEVTELNIPNSVTSIGNSAFYGCSGLTSVTIPNSVTSIGNSAFYGCSGLTSVTIPNSVTSIGNSAFKECSNLTDLMINSNYKLSETYTSSNNLSNIFGTQVKTLTIGDEVNSIGSYAFYGFSNLTDLTIYSNDVLGKTYTYSDNLLNRFGKNVETLKIGERVKSIGSYAFYGFSNLASIIIPNSVSTIGDFAFYGTKWFDNQPDGLVYVGLVAYAYKGEMPSGALTIKDGTVGICPYVFRAFTGLTSVTIPNSVTSIGDGAFQACTGLTSVTIPNSVTSIGEGVFSNCSGLESIIVEKGNSVYDSRNGCNAIIETVSNKLIQGCRTTIIPNEIVEIGNRAFSVKGFINITIPASVSCIDSYAFYGYDRLNVTFKGTTPPKLADKAFGDLSKTYAIVPKGCTAHYSSIGFKQVSEKSEDYPLVTIHLTEPGMLQEMALDIEETDIRNLKLVGPVNSADINHLRTSARFTNISYLDMSDVVLIADNNSYCSSKGFGNFYLSDVNYSYDIVYDSGLGFYSHVTQFYGNSFGGVFIGMKVREVVLPRNITRIGAYCFANCTELQKIEIPDGVTVIEQGAFYGCISLTGIKLPSSVTKISKYAFCQCVALQIASLDNVTQIGSSAFYLCESLRYVGSLAKVKNIEEGSFAGCSSLVGEIDLSGVPVISKNAFKGCASLSNVIFSENLQSIGESAFEQCTNLRAVRFPESTKAVLLGAFSGCSKLSNVSYSRNLLQVSKLTFTDTPFFDNLECVDGIKYMGHIAMCIEGDPVSRISFREGTLSIADDFIYTSSNKDYTTVCTELLLPNSLLRIGNYAFTEGRNSYRGLGITKLSLPENLLEIGDNAFSYSKSISQITLPESLIYVGNAAFYGCDGLVRVIYNASSLMSNISSSRSNDVHGIFEGTGIEKVTIGPKVRILPSAVFMECEKLMKVEFADRTSDDHLYVGPYSFYSCKALTNIVLPESTDSIGIYAFRYCRALSNVILPDSIQRVGEGAFQDCPWLDTYLNNQPDGVVYVGLVAFGYKGNMPEGTTISLREGTKSIAYMAFERCDGMEHLIIPNTVESIGDDAFMGCRNLKSIKMGTGIISIGDYAFENCNALSNIELPSNVNTIGIGAFYTCRNLKKITIGKNVSEIGSVAFYGLENINDVTVLRENPEEYNCSNNVFESYFVGVIDIGTTYYSHPENATLHVPEGCVEAYKNCYPWCRFGTIVDDAITSVLPPTIEILPSNEDRVYDDKTIYNLQGRRVMNPQKGGVYIIGGKKVIK